MKKILLFTSFCVSIASIGLCMTLQPMLQEKERTIVPTILVDHNQVSEILIADEWFIKQHLESIQELQIMPLAPAQAQLMPRTNLQTIYVEANVFDQTDQAWLYQMYERGITIVGINMPMSDLSNPLRGRAYLQDLPKAPDRATVGDLPPKAGWMIWSNIDKSGSSVGQMSWYYQTFAEGVEGVHDMQRRSGR